MMFTKLLMLITILAKSAKSRSETYIPTPDIDGIEKVKIYVSERIREAEMIFNDSKFERMQSPKNWAHDIVYSIQVDRFNNGDYNNDDLNLPPEQKKGSIYDSEATLNGLHNYRHGGDLQGIIDRLDYLQDLGINSLWITPFLKHNGEYHGYCTASLTEIDPGFGKIESLIELVQKAHSKGIKIIMDVVINHLCDRKTRYSKTANHNLAASSLANGISNGEGILEFSDSFFRPFKTQRFFNRAGPNNLEEMQSNGNEAIYGDFTDGMFDYNTNDSDFQALFTDFMSYWIAIADIDGFRLDAAKHVTQDFIAYFCSKTRNYASSLGKNNFYIVGEIAGPDDWAGSRLGKMFINPDNYYDHGVIPSLLANIVVKQSQDSNSNLKFSTNFKNHKNFPHPGLNAVYDFSHSGIARSVFRNDEKLSKLEDYFDSKYFKTLEGQSDPSLNWNVLEIHDWNRFLMGFEVGNYKHSIASIAYLMTSFGIPQIYYGEEQGFNQNGHHNSIHLKNAEEIIQVFARNESDSIKRQDMFMGPWRLGSAIVEIDNLNYIGSVIEKKYTVANDPYLNTKHELYANSKVLINIRKSCITLMEGRQYFRKSHDDSRIVKFSRILRDEEIVVVINISNDELNVGKVTVDNHLNFNNKTYINLMNRSEKAQVEKDENGAKLDIKNIKAHSFKIFVFIDNATVIESSVGSINYLTCKPPAPLASKKLRKFHR